MNNQMTLAGLLRHLFKNLWWIIVLAIIGAGGMFFAAKHSAPVSGTYSASRAMYIGHANYVKTQDPKSALSADKDLVRTYLSFSYDRTIVNETTRLMRVAGFEKVDNAAVVKYAKLQQVPGTLTVRARVLMPNEKEAIALANSYAQAFATKAPKLVPGMPAPRLMVAIQGAAKADDSEPISPKKAAIFGAGAGLGIGVILALFTGIIASLRPSKRQ